MQILDEYESIILAYCADREGFIKNYSHEYDSDLLNALIFSLKLDFIAYQNIIEKVDFDRIDKSSMEYFVFLEGKIRFLACTKSKEVHDKKNTPLVTEFLDMCEASLSKFQYAFIASTELALRFELQKEYKKAVPILVNIYDYGFKSTITLYSIILVSSEGREWEVAKSYVKFVQPTFNRFLTRTFIAFVRYSMFRLTFLLFCIFVPFLNYWYFFISGLLIICILILICSSRYKNRDLFSFLIYFLFILLFGLLIGLGLKYFG